MRFRKKPVVIEAIRWDGSVEALDAIREWQPACGVAGHEGQLLIETAEGTLYAARGSWIIQGVAGEIYPCRPDIFAKTYEPVDAARAAPPAEGGREGLESKDVRDLLREASRPFTAEELETPPGPGALTGEREKRWKRLWAYDPKLLTLSIRPGIRDLRGDRVDYEIDLERCRTSAQVLDWIAQVAGKAWAWPDLIGCLCYAFEAVFDLQATFCGMGVERGPVDVARRLAEHEAEAKVIDEAIAAYDKGAP
jgi:hypothetical protein